MKNILGNVVALCVLVAVGFIGWKVYEKLFKQNDSDITVVEQIKKVAKLQTIEITAATTLEKTKKDWAGAKKHTVYFAEGTVTASINLENMEIKLDKEKNLVSIVLPKQVEVSNPSHDNFRKICTYGTLTAPNFSDAEISRHVNEAFSIIKTRAMEKGIEAMAQKHAREYLTTFINALGREVQFI
ncbi:MAG: DUF4230 domain-containing protein [Chitinispirillaceae bacterium]|nr:DUF4230 domain-containing protein [Chitinispirillaceae bacterium]